MTVIAIDIGASRGWLSVPPSNQLSKHRVANVIATTTTAAKGRSRRLRTGTHDCGFNRSMQHTDHCV